MFTAAFLTEHPPYIKLTARMKDLLVGLYVFKVPDSFVSFLKK